jgi:hypothetical protein
MRNLPPAHVTGIAHRVHITGNLVGHPLPENENVPNPESSIISANLYRFHACVDHPPVLRPGLEFMHPSKLMVGHHETDSFM